MIWFGIGVIVGVVLAEAGRFGLKMVMKKYGKLRPTVSPAS